MQKTIHPHQPWCQLLAPKPTFNLFIACENQNALFQARRVRDQIESLCGKEADVSSVFWSFALFRNEQLRARATVEAAEADMIVVSLEGGHELPPHVRDWVESWPARPQPGHTVLVTLVCAERENQAQCQQQILFFRQAATNCGLDFLCNQDGWERVDRFNPAASILGLVQGVRQSFLPDEMEWGTGGINE